MNKHFVKSMNAGKGCDAPAILAARTFLARRKLFLLLIAENFIC